MPPDQIRALELLKDRAGFFVLMGSAADKVSYEATRFRQGLLTYSILEALKGAKLREGRYANVSLLFHYAENRVPTLALNIGAIQQPKIFIPDVGDSFDIGLFTAVEQQLFSLPSPSPFILRPTLINQDLARDNLRLNVALQNALIEASYTSANGNEPSLVFVEADEMTGAFQPAGLYTISGDKVTIKLNLVRGESESVVPPQLIEGTITDEQSKAALIKKIVAVIITETQKLVK